MKFTPRFCLISAQPYHNLCRVAIPDLKTNGKYLNEQPLSGSLHTLDLNRHPGELCAGIVALTQENANVTKLPAHAGALTVSPDFVGARGRAYRAKALCWARKARTDSFSPKLLFPNPIASGLG